MTRQHGAMLTVTAALALVAAAPLASQSRPPLDRVLAFPAPIPGEELPSDRGAAGAWHRIRKLETTVGILHVTSHPDDEQSGMLALASRGWGARTALFSLNRGEAGANAIGSEIFDALGLIRTRELVLSGRYYGLDDLYFTTAADYGYSKSVEEAFRSWDREAVLEDMVRVIRLNRPLVVVSRWHGSPRDGHGHHHATGLLTPEAVVAAADPGRFPEQIVGEGLRPWTVRRVYRGGARTDEIHHVSVDAGKYSPWLGATYRRWAALGLSLQRSQTSGRVRRGGGAYKYERLRALPDEVGEPVDSTFFSGLDTSLTGLPALVGEEAAPEVEAALAGIQALVDGVLRDFDFRAPSRSVPELARGLTLLRSITADAERMPDAAAVPETLFHLAVKERQFEDAIVAAAGLVIRAELADETESAVLVPGQSSAVRATVENPARVRAEVVSVRLVAGTGTRLAETRPEEVVSDAPAEAPEPNRESDRPGAGSARTVLADIRVPFRAEAGASGPYFARTGPSQNHYQVADSSDLHLPWRRADLSAEVTLRVEGPEVVRTVPVTGTVPRLPYGSIARRAEVLPALSVSVTPGVTVFVDDGSGRARPAEVLVRVEANTAAVSAETHLELPSGWSVAPASARHSFGRAGEALETAFMLHPPAGWSGEADIRAVAEAVAEGTTPRGHREYRTGFQVIDHRDLPPTRLRIPARTTAQLVRVAPLDGLNVGYVMGAGDEVPAAVEALGARVQLLDGSDLSTSPLGGFDAVVVGTRAYAVRRDLVDNNQRILDYARQGGNLIVLYQTPEFVPSAMAPYHAVLPRNAEEVSEEDASVRLLAPDHPLLAAPNRISESDFDHWLEQRGSKFFSEWDPAYTPLVETRDAGQAPQRGVWLVARTGRGHYSYLALALHRQLPYGVPGAYRILSNAISLGRDP